MRNILIGLLLLSSIVFCQSYVPKTAEIEVIVPDNQIVTRVSIFVEIKDTQAAILLQPGMTLAQILALNPVQSSVATSLSDTIITDMPTVADGKFWRAAVIGFDTNGNAVTGVGVSTIVQAPLEYGTVNPSIKIIFK